tara:strand:+ start:202 stop:1185 length:984 start_codon:yes stop_codon:yes gene_type:complete
MGVGLQNKIESIQVLRFFAAFSVMMVHLPVFEFGIWGVDIFFVISGFIMMYVTENNEKFFLLKRIFRIVPLYWILTLGVFVLAIFIPEVLNNTTANTAHLIKSLFFIPFDKNGTGHFPILFLGWTLNFEVIFYFLFSLSLVFFKENRMIACSIFIIIFLVFNKVFSEKNFIFETYANDIFIEFIFGMVLFMIWKRYKNKISTNLTNHFMCLTILLVSIFILNYYNFSRSISYGLPSLILAIYFLFFLNHLKFPKILVSLGDASYCIYLLHPYVIQFFYKILEINEYDIIIELVFTLIISIIVFIISLLIYKFIEFPINGSLRKKFIN